MQLSCSVVQTKLHRELAEEIGWFGVDTVLLQSRIGFIAAHDEGGRPADVMLSPRCTLG
jgi:hypothetical protein